MYGLSNLIKSEVVSTPAAMALNSGEKGRHFNQTGPANGLYDLSGVGLQGSLAGNGLSPLMNGNKMMQGQFPNNIMSNSQSRYLNNFNEG